MVKIAPSILAADMGHLARELDRTRSGDWLHVDVMDGHFVPGISFGYPVMAALGRYTALPLDVHLMVSDPLTQAESYARAGASSVTLHLETGDSGYLNACLDRLDACGVRKGLAIRPATPPEAVLPYLERLDLVLVMTVEPGFGGQKFILSQLDAIARMRRFLEERNPHCLLEIDGGVNPSTAKQAVAAGANVLVAGSAVFGAEDPAAAIAALRE